MGGKITPWEVGVKDAAIAVAIQGEVTATDDGSITIAGWTLPTCLGNGVRTVSMHLETDTASVNVQGCNLVHIDDYDGSNVEECGHEGMDALLAAVRREHDGEHSGAFRYCRDAICAAASEVTS